MLRAQDSLCPHPVRLLDETLRDGIQSSGVRDPSLEDKRRIVALLDETGIDHVTLGFPGAGARTKEHCRALARHIADERLSIRAGCAARTRQDDLEPIVDIAGSAGIPLEVMAFVGSSPIRLYIEDWDLAKVRELSTSAIDFVVKNGLACTLVTEDATRAHPDVLADLFRSAIDHGATRLCLCDTVGHATASGVKNLIEFTLEVIERAGMSGRIGIDWHGHNDRGLGVSNSLYALHCGADRIHGTVLGTGERAGNAALELLFLQTRGSLGPAARSLGELVRQCASALALPLPVDHPALPGPLPAAKTPAAASALSGRA